MSLTPTDETTTLRVDATRSGASATLVAGSALHHRTYQFQGRIPMQPNRPDSTVPARTVDTTIDALRPTAYAEMEGDFVSPFVIRVGGRAEYQTRASQTVFDPRIAISWPISSQNRLRAAWGIYHQFPDLSTHAKHDGARTLQAQRAQHVVVGFRHKRDDVLLRAEAYHKAYTNVVVRTSPGTFSNTGTGYAQGVDFFAKYGTFLNTRVNGWVSYSILESRRTQPRYRGRRVELENGPTPYDLTHQLTLVGKMRLVDQVRIGGTYRYTSGQPFTPIVGTRRVGPGKRFPIEGPVGSERLPSYRRLDLQVSYYWPFTRQQHLIAYVAVTNLMNRDNVIDVTYSSDYTGREWQTTHFVRSLYLGLTLTL